MTSHGPVHGWRCELYTLFHKESTQPISLNVLSLTCLCQYWPSEMSDAKYSVVGTENATQNKTLCKKQYSSTRTTSHVLPTK